MRLPSKDSTVWRAVVTAGQTAVGMVVLWFTVPEFKAAVEHCWREVSLFVPLAGGAASGVWNWFRKDVRNF